jgi:beta-galactosidase
MKPRRHARRLLLVLAGACSAACLGIAQERPRIDLNGEWEFRLDPESRGEAARWYSGRERFADTIRVPGSWQAQGFGERSGVLRHDYAGNAWYRRDVPIPSDWNGRSVVLRVGGVLRRATVFINGQLAGEHDGFSTPFSLNVTDSVRPGAANTFVFLVANPAAPIEESPDKQKATEPTGMLNYIGNWGGIYGNVEIEAMSPTWIDEVAILSDIRKPQARFKISVRSRESGNPYPARVEVEVDRFRGSAELMVQPGRETAVEIAVEMPGARLWSPGTPHLYTAAIRLLSGGEERDRIAERFGMREIVTRGDVLLLNGKPFYLRGFGDDNIEVLTGVPPASKEVYLERLRLARSFGFNGVRFHSMTPVREYFEAADEVGLLVMAELPAAYTMYVLPHKQFLRKELERVLRTHRNHPSFLSLAFGNEFNLNWLASDAEKKEFKETVTDFYLLAKSIDPDRIILSNDGYVMRPTDMVSVFRDPPGDVPAVRHEFGNYYCSLPDISLIDKFAGVIVPTWLHQKKAWVEKSGLISSYPVLLHNSQRLQHAGRKYQIERARRLQEFTGYHYWLIVDFPGGTGEGDSWEEGWFDYFWRPKGILPQEGRELNSAVLLIIDSGVDDRTMWSDSRKRIDVYVSNYGRDDIFQGVLDWKLLSEDRAVGGGVLTGVRVPLGKVLHVGEIVVGPVEIDRARKLELVLELRAGDSSHTNRWNLWAFPRQDLLTQTAGRVVSTVRWAGLNRLYPFIQPWQDGTDPSTLLITSTFDSRAKRFLESGGRVWLLADRAQFERNGDSTYFPASGGAQGTILKDHPALDGFPSDGFCDLQCYSLLEGAWNFPLDRWPKSLTPIAGGVRTTSSFLSKKKDLSRTGYIFEVKSGAGRLLVTTLRLRDQLDEAYPEAVYLFDRLLRYASGPAFHPETEVTDELLRRLMVR